jgi:hypothetical protein
MDARPTRFAVAFLAIVAAAGMARAQSSYPCTGTNSNLPNPYHLVENWASPPRPWSPINAVAVDPNNNLWAVDRCEADDCVPVIELGRSSGRRRLCRSTPRPSGISSANAREFITDCFIYPNGRPNNELAPPENRTYGVTVFAEFDPSRNIFKTTTFSAGDNYLPFEYRAAALRSGRRDLTAEQNAAFSYARRKPFMCAAARPTQRAPTGELDVEAYQYAATRTLQVSVARPATSAFLERLQGFAERKGFKTWKAGADGKEVSLALRIEEILVIALDWRAEGLACEIALPM